MTQGPRTTNLHDVMIICLGTTPVYQRSMEFERLAVDGVNRAIRVSDYASGKSLNAARVIRTLGCDALAAGFVGGSRGKMIRADLDAAGIRHDFVTLPAETRQCVTVIDRAAGTATELVEESSPVDEAYWGQLEEKLQNLLPQSKLWLFSGSLPPGAPQDFYARWLPLASRVGATAIVDVRGEPLRLAMKCPGAILKLNRDELAETLSRDLSRDADLLNAVRQNVPAGGTMIVTLGAKGAVGSDGHSCWRVRSPKVKAVSAVGSGDSFAAGLAVGLSQGRPLPEALRLATACGAANALTPLAGHLDLSAVDRLMTEARSEPIA